MNPQERQQLSLFLKQLVDAQAGEKNPEAAALILDAVAKQPDAAYLLVQRAMLVEQALNTAKTQIAQLQTQLQKQSQNAQSDRPNSGFLSGGNPWAQGLNSNTRSAGVPGAENYQTPRAGSVPASPAPAGLPFGGGSGGFLGNMATTAAGVVAGSFLFQGIENLMGNHHSSADAWANADHAPEQTVINNYYDTPGNAQASNGVSGPDDWSQTGGGDDYLASSDDESLFGDGDDSSWI